jgi:YHS domain-containing protein
LLQLHGRSIWLKDLNDPALVPRVFDYAQAMLDAGTVRPVPDGLVDHVYERYLSGTRPRLGHDQSHDGEGLDHLDPVCLMEVDSAAARHTLEYAGRTIAFCALSCKKLFLVDPSAYLVV